VFSYTTGVLTTKRAALKVSSMERCVSGGQYFRDEVIPTCGKWNVAVEYVKGYEMLQRQKLV
jgi:hypothetical protein